jgi:predicted ATP-dependent endonuclease of OLD family
MKLYKLHIEGFRKLKKVDVLFGDATFCIGKNNSGKSSVLYAIEWLLSGNKRIDGTEYYSEIDQDTKETKIIDNTIFFEAEFRNVPIESENWDYFKGRTFKYDIPKDSNESGICIFYRKTFPLGKDVIVELKSKETKRTLKPEYEECLTPQDYINKGANSIDIESLFPNLTKKILVKDKGKLEDINELWDMNEIEEWIQDPGGIQGNILTKLPKFLRIPAESSAYELDDAKKGVLGKTLLAKELNPADSASEFGKMIRELNAVLSGIFPDTQIHAIADLSDPNKTLLPSFTIQMSSNIKTTINQQGTGMIRSAVFGMLRFRQKWLSKREGQLNRSLIIGFEEPEIYLHPSAANQMRDTIYELSSEQSQIIATTHSPYMIDLSRKPRQVLNRFRSETNETNCHPFNVTEEFIRLSDDNKSYVKMILKIDDYVARSFFTKKVIIVEGNSEEVAIREAIRCLSESVRLQINSDFEIINARGKATIIGLAKYLKALNVDFCVIHDRDKGMVKAEIFNQPILEAAGDSNLVIVLEECLEDILGYKAPSNEKPFRVFKETLKWQGEWNNIPEKFRQVLTIAFEGYITL